MDHASLLAFVTVAERHSFTEAADQLHLTQPAISKRIANLESRLASALFHRIGHNIQLTASGKLLLPQAKKLLQDMANTRQQIQNLSDKPLGPLQIATGHHIGLHRLPSVWKELSQNHPEIDLDILFMDSEEAYQQVLEGNIECAVLTLPKLLDPKLINYPIWHDELGVYCAAGSTLAMDPTLSAQKLSTFPVILPNKNTFTRTAILEYFLTQSIDLPRIKTGDYLETIKTLVECGLGWSVLPISLKNNKISRLLKNDFKLSRTLGLIHHHKRPLSNAGQRFLDLLNLYGDFNHN